MTPKPANRTTIDDLIAAIPSCALDQAGRLRQYERYRQLATTVSRVDNQTEALVVQFDDRLDRDLLERTLAVERRCCPFFVFEVDVPDHRLAISVRRSDQLPALAAMAAAFTAPKASRTRSQNGT